MRTMSIDIETYSDIDIKYGVHKYVSSPNFEVLLFGFAFDDEAVQVIDLTKTHKLSQAIMAALYDKEIRKTAFNAAFEITCLRRLSYLHDMPPEQWECSSVLAKYNGLPNTLSSVAKVLKLEEQKDTRGKNLIKYFSCPCKPTKVNGNRTRNYPEHDPDKWATYIEYNRQDVVVEREIRKKLISHKPPESERRLWLLDLQINDHGVRVDEDLVQNAIQLNSGTVDTLTAEMKAITELDNPNSVAQLKDWLDYRMGEKPESLDKAALNELLALPLAPDVRRVLTIRKQLGKSSVKKYEAMANTKVELNGQLYCHDLFQFYGAGRTGRWAGRTVQLQNLPRNSMPDLDLARKLVKAGDASLLNLLYDNVPDVLSQLIRTALIPSKGNTFFVADFSAIEARVIAWLSGEKWRIETFKNGGDIYCESASQMFGVPVVKHGINGELRQKGKVAELALGYGGGANALISMGALKQGLTEGELPDIVTRWRAKSPKIIEFWNACDTAAKNAIIYGKTVTLPNGISFEKTKGALLIHLISGRDLTYLFPKIGTNRFGGESIEYKGMAQTAGVFTTLETYGGKLVENIVQAVARDCLGAAMMRLQTAGYQVVGHIHDEVIIDAPSKDPDATLKEIVGLMCTPTDWNKGLPLNADGFYSDYYKKD